MAHARWVGWLLCGFAAACSTTDEGSGAGGGPNTGPGPSGTGGAAPATWGSSECGTCVYEACRSALDACLADPECPAYAQCLESCPVADDGNVDPTCAAACPRGTGSEALRAAAAIDACRDPGPGAACPACNVPNRAEVPPVPALNQTCTEPSLESNPCFICQDENCCESIAACEANPECVAYRSCVNDFAGPGDPFNTCALEHPGGVAARAEGFACGVFHCAMEAPNCDPAKREPCMECFVEDCGLEFATLFGSAEGFLLAWCVAYCPPGDIVCDNACEAAHPSAIDDYYALGACTFAACGEAC